MNELGKSKKDTNSVLTASPLNSNTQLVRKDGSAKLSQKNSPSIPSSSSSSTSSQLLKKTPTSGGVAKSGSSSASSMKIKPITEDGMKVRISKEQQLAASGKLKLNSSTPNSKLLNFSAGAVEVQLKPRSTSPHVNLTPVMPDQSSSSTTAMSKISLSGANSARTPSPLQSSFSIATPSPGIDSDQPESFSASAKLASSATCNLIAKNKLTSNLRIFSLKTFNCKY